MYNFLSSSLKQMFYSNNIIKNTKPINHKMEILLKKLKNEGIIQSQIVYNAMSQVDRGEFSDSKSCYDDCPQSISYNATISAPHMHAYALEYLKDYLKPGGRALDIGAGSGYLSVAMSKMMNDEGQVIGIEHIPQLASLAKENISKSSKDLLDSEKIIIMESDGIVGCEKYAPYNAIHVGAAAVEVPNELLKQLASNGRMVIPIGEQGKIQSIYIINKDSEGKINYLPTLSVSYVPLTSKDKQLKYF